MSSVTRWIDAARSFVDGVGGAAEQGLEALVRHGQAGAPAEVAQVQVEAAVGLHVHQVLADHVGEARLAVGCEPHELVLAVVHPKATVGGERRIQQPQAVREVQAAVQGQRTPAAHAQARGLPLPHAVQAQHQGLVEVRRVEGAGGVGVVVVGELDPAREAQSPELALQVLSQEQPLPQPQGSRRREGPEAPRREGQPALEQPLELHEGLFVVDDVVHVGGRPPGRLERARDRRIREPGVVLDPGQALLLDGGDDAPVLD